MNLVAPPQPVECYTISTSPPRPLVGSPLRWGVRLGGAISPYLASPQEGVLNRLVLDHLGRSTVLYWCPKPIQTRTKKIVPVHRVSFWKGVLRDYLLRRCWMLKFLGKKRERQLLRRLSSEPFSEGHLVYRDNFRCLKNKRKQNAIEPAILNHELSTAGGP